MPTQQLLYNVTKSSPELPEGQTDRLVNTIGMCGVLPKLYSDVWCVSGLRLGHVQSGPDCHVKSTLYTGMPLSYLGEPVLYTLWPLGGSSGPI